MYYQKKFLNTIILHEKSFFLESDAKAKLQ